jgi:DNA-binding response OmpR family regulator
MPQVANYIRSLLDAQSKVKLLDVITDGREVAEQVRELQPDLLIVDALLQGKLNGLQVATDLREAGLNVPIIALTVPTRPIAVGEGMGSTRVLSMPFSGYDFMHLVQELIDEHRARTPEAFSRVIAVFGAKGGVGPRRSPTTSPRPSRARPAARGSCRRQPAIRGSPCAAPRR